jgi:hypothetical protein
MSAICSMVGPFLPQEEDSRKRSLACQRTLQGPTVFWRFGATKQRPQSQPHTLNPLRISSSSQPRRHGSGNCRWRSDVRLEGQGIGMEQIMRRSARIGLAAAILLAGATFAIAQNGPPTGGYPPARWTRIFMATTATIIATTPTIVSTPPWLATGTIIALVGRGEVTTRSQLVECQLARFQT